MEAPYRDGLESAIQRAEKAEREVESLKSDRASKRWEKVKGSILRVSIWAIIVLILGGLIFKSHTCYRNEHSIPEQRVVRIELPTEVVFPIQRTDGLWYYVETCSSKSRRLQLTRIIDEMPLSRSTRQVSVFLRGVPQPIWEGGFESVSATNKRGASAPESQSWTVSAPPGCIRIAISSQAPFGCNRDIEGRHATILQIEEVQ